MQLKNVVDKATVRKFAKLYREEEGRPSLTLVVKPLLS